MQLAEFNAMDPADAEEELRACCASSVWAGQVTAGRPYPALSAVFSTASAALDALTWEDVSEALDAHPRIGARVAGEGREARWSRREQSGADGADPDTRAALVTANEAYEQRFGHVFLIFATGRTDQEMLAAARERLTNDDETEQQIVREELGRIVHLRLERLFTE